MKIVLCFILDAVSTWRSVLSPCKSSSRARLFRWWRRCAAKEPREWLARTTSLLRNCSGPSADWRPKVSLKACRPWGKKKNNNMSSVSTRVTDGNEGKRPLLTVGKRVFTFIRLLQSVSTSKSQTPALRIGKIQVTPPPPTKTQLYLSFAKVYRNVWSSIKKSMITCKVLQNCRSSI